MPYINEELRKTVNDSVDKLAEAVKECGRENRAGVLNYSVSCLINKLYDLKYSEINEAVGVLECIKQEYYRRVASPYEDKKILENGDVYR